MKCKFCGAEVDFGNFCTYCGSRLENNSSESKVESESKGNWTVAIFKDMEDNSYLGYDYYTESEIGPLRDHDRCLKLLTKAVHDVLIENGGLSDEDDPSSEEDYKKDSYVKKLLNKGFKVEYCQIDVVFEEDEIEEYEDDDDDDEDSFSDGKVYAVLRKKGLFYEGEIPGMSFGKVNLAHSRQECIDELLEAYNRYAGGMFDKTSTYNLRKIKSKYSSWEIIELS